MVQSLYRLFPVGKALLSLFKTIDGLISFIRISISLPFPEATPGWHRQSIWPSELQGRCVLRCIIRQAMLDVLTPIYLAISAGENAQAPFNGSKLISSFSSRYVALVITIHPALDHGLEPVSPPLLSSCSTMPSSIIKKHFKVPGRDNVYPPEHFQVKKILVSRDQIISVCCQSAGLPRDA